MKYLKIVVACIALFLGIGVIILLIEKRMRSLKEKMASQRRIIANLKIEKELGRLSVSEEESKRRQETAAIALSNLNTELEAVNDNYQNKLEALNKVTSWAELDALKAHPDFQ